VGGAAQVAKAGSDGLAEQVGELAADRGGKQIGSERPVLDHHGGAQVSASSSISGLLLPLAHLVADGGDDDLLSGIDARQVNGGMVGRHWSEPLWVSGMG